MNTNKLYRKFQYAELKQVSRPYISKLITAGKLKTRFELGETCIIDCQENDDLFLNPAHNRRAPAKKAAKKKMKNN